MKKAIFHKSFGLVLATSLTLLANQAVSKEMSMMQIAKHTSPMPSLMMLIGNNADELGLDNEQLETVRSWRMQNMSESKMLMQEILELEKEIGSEVLEGLTEKEVEELKADLLEARGNLIDLKYECISTMKGALDDEQWMQLMEIRNKTMRIAQDKSGGNEIQAFLRVSPMPKFMAVILMHSQDLGLSPDQHKALEKWRLKNMNHWATLFDQVLTLEKGITDDAIVMEDKGELMSRFEEINKKRHEMARMSLECRDNMRKVLDDEQWKMVVEKFQMYRNAR